MAHIVNDSKLVQQMFNCNDNKARNRLRLRCELHAIKRLLRNETEKLRLTSESIDNGRNDEIKIEITVKRPIKTNPKNQNITCTISKW